MWGFVCFCSFVIFCGAYAAEDAKESKVVYIAQGPVRGYKDPSSGVYFYQSIPYATAPTGVNKFKAPLPPPTWTEPLEAVSSHIACPQFMHVGPVKIEMNQQEDCLIASVYVPDTQERDLPVVVYVHGGAFQVGTGDMILPTALVAENNIIAVTFNYRVGTHGFLCLGTEDVPGNAGMKDQVAALKWVKQNIASFGGNPDEVTIAGYSAGSAAVDLLMLSKSAEGLFNKVIPESGASIGVWTIQTDPLENAKNFAKNLNFTDVDDIDALENFYKTASFDVLNVPFFDKIDSTFGPSPCVERSTSEEPFLDKSPVDILKSGDYRKVPLLYGFASMEGLIRIDFFETWKDKMNEKFSDFLPPDLAFESTEQREEVARLVKSFYFEDKPVGADTVLAYVDFFSDVMFAYPMLRTVKYHVEAGHDQIYLYDYDYVDENTPDIPHAGIKGAFHCAQSAAIFNVPSFDGKTKTTDEFLKMSATLRSIWGNFIKTGAPVPVGSGLPAWPAARAGRAPHMSLGRELALRGPLLEPRARFWDAVYTAHYRDPAPPPEPRTRRSEL
uniref:Carboxylic ester hydrolase n=1 Tax=Ectropis obliqua TaxID=248899 RepID=A0A2U3T8K2_ECTOB|nr:putative antennal esterase CXE12 [Ectropis obliqua]